MNILVSMLAGVNFLHEDDIYHSYLNPEDILVTTYPEYNIYKIKENIDINSHEITSYMYMSPELLDDYDFQNEKNSDIWSIGCIIYELCYGKVILS